MSNLWKSVMHGVVSIALFAIPMILTSGAPWMGMTIGGVLNAIYHFLLLQGTTTS